MCQPTPYSRADGRDRRVVAADAAAQLAGVVATADRSCLTDSIIEDRARALKASALVAVLHYAGATAATIRHLDDDGWRTAAQAAGVRAPSHATCALVARWFTDRAQPTVDLFAGLDDAA